MKCDDAKILTGRLAQIIQFTMKHYTKVNVWVYKISRGKCMNTFPGGVPICLATIEGRKTGVYRETPLLHIPFKDKKMVLHAGALMTLGMLSGIPLAMTMLGYMDGDPADWKISHMEGLINGLLMLAIAGCGGLLTLSFRQQLVLLGCVLFPVYSNALYRWMRGLSGEHGMDFAPAVANQVVVLLGGLPRTKNTEISP